MLFTIPSYEFYLEALRDHPGYLKEELRVLGSSINHEEKKVVDRSGEASLEKAREVLDIIVNKREEKRHHLMLSLLAGSVYTNLELPDGAREPEFYINNLLFTASSSFMHRGLIWFSDGVFAISYELLLFNRLSALADHYGYEFITDNITEQV